MLLLGFCAYVDLQLPTDDRGLLLVHDRCTLLAHVLLHELVQIVQVPLDFGVFLDLDGVLKILLDHLDPLLSLHEVLKLHGLFFAFDLFGWHLVCGVDRLVDTHQIKVCAHFGPFVDLLGHVAATQLLLHSVGKLRQLIDERLRLVLLGGHGYLLFWLLSGFIDHLLDRSGFKTLVSLVELDAALSSSLALYLSAYVLVLFHFRVPRSVELPDFLVALAQVGLSLLLHVFGELLLVMLLFELPALFLDILLDELVEGLLLLAGHFGSLLLRLVEKPFSTEGGAEWLRPTRVLSLAASLLVDDPRIGVRVVPPLLSLLACLLNPGVVVC